MSGEVRSVKAVDGGAEPRPSLKRSLGETVCVEDAAPPALIAVKLAVLSQVNSFEPSKWLRSKSSVVSIPELGVRSCSKLVKSSGEIIPAILLGTACAWEICPDVLKRGTGGLFRKPIEEVGSLCE